MCVNAARTGLSPVYMLSPSRARAGRLGWVGALVAVSLVCNTVRCTPRPELSDFEMLHIVTGDTGAQPAAHGRHAVREAQWDAIDAQLLAASPAKPQMLASGANWIEEDTGDGFEPYTEDLDSQITISGVPDSLIDGDSVLHSRYEDWIRKYKRVPNEPEMPWSYDGPDSSPDLWSTLKKDYQLCDPDLTGKMSSPISIPTDQALPACYGPSFPVKNGPVYEGGSTVLTEYVDRSFTVNVQQCTQACKICDAVCEEGPAIAGTSEHKPMVLDRIVFHTPSEHKIDNEAAALELQFYHCIKGESQDHMPCTPSLAFAVLFKDGGPTASNPEWLNKFYDTLGKVGDKPEELAKGMKMEEISAAIDPLFAKYYNYIGSQTYPPCYQGVQWMVGEKMLEASTSLIEGFKTRQGENVRPDFPLGYRQLKLMSKESDKHWTYDGPRGQKWWPKYVDYASCGTGAEDCEILPDQAKRDACIADSKVQSPIDIYTREW
jgi:carbonic anhydrase